MRINNVRLAFPHIYKPTAFAPGQPEKYSATFIIPDDHPELAAVKAEVSRHIKEKWGEPPQGLVVCLRSGEEKSHLDGFNKTMFFNASSDSQPGTFDRDGSELSVMDGRLYAGCWVNAVVDFWAQANQYGKRINAHVRGVQFVKDGDRFGSGAAAASASDFPVLDDPVEDPFAQPAAAGGDDWMS